jgi:hypothetical protein
MLFGLARGFGAFGLIARIVTMECPLCPKFGEGAQELGVEVTAGRDEDACIA